MTLTDAGPLVALVDNGQPSSRRCREVYATLWLPLLTTWPAFTEALYLLGKTGGWPHQANLWQHLVNETLVIHFSNAEEQLRMRALMEQYRDRPMDLADASLVAAAEGRGDRRIFTIDSDFYVYQWNGRESFEVLT